MPLNKDNNNKIKQVLSLYISMVLSLIVGIGVSVFNTRILGPQQFGDYKFLQMLFNFTVLFFPLGFFTTGSYMLAKKENAIITSDLTGSILIVATFISLFYIFSIIGFSFFQGKIFNNRLDESIRILSPLLFIFPFQLCVTNILQGTNRIFELSLFRLMPSILYLAVALAMTHFFSFSLFNALFIHLLTFSLVIFATVAFINPSFNNIKSHINDIFQVNKYYGSQVYIGALVSVASAQLGGLAIAFYVDNVNVGYFSLAVTITAPLMMVPNVVGTTFFKSFANSPMIPKKLIIATLAITVAGLGGFFFIAKWVVLSLYSEDYLPVVSLSYILSVGSVLHGLGDFTNRFLGAHGQGKYLRNGTMIVGIVNIIGYIFFVYFLGIKGAAITRLSGSAVYCAIMCLFYKKYIGNNHCVESEYSVGHTP